MIAGISPAVAYGKLIEQCFRQAKISGMGY